MRTLNIDLPDELYRKLQARAKREGRSAGQEASYPLAQALGSPEPLSILALRGLGKELWKGVEATAHVRQERTSWD